MNKEERWKLEFEQFKKDLNYLRKSLEYVQKDEKDEMLRRLLFGGMLQGFGVVIRRSSCVMNEYMQSLGQGKNKSLKNILVKALKMNLITQKRWLDAEEDLNAVYDVEDMQASLKMEKKINKIYLPLFTRFELDMEAKTQPTLFG